MDKQPEYAAGKEQLMKFFMRNLRYPEKALNSKVDGTFILTFIVDETGKVKDPKITENIPSSAQVLNEVVIVGYKSLESKTLSDNSDEGRKSIENELLRVVNKLEDFTPAIQNGKPIETQMALALRFKISQ